MMRKPKALRPGDTLSLISPASPLTPAQTAKGIAILEAEGYKVKVYPSTYAEFGYLAGTDEARAKDVMDAFLDPETQAVYCARGGYGCSRLMPFLDLDALAKSEKLFLGFSDITVLHAALNRRGLATVHAPMALTLNTDRQPWVYESFTQVLKGCNPIPATTPKATCVVPGKAKGIVGAGCLILVTDLIGTPEEIDMTGMIVVIEDVDEAPHRVDAMLTHLLNAGHIQKAAGIVVGEMTRSDEKPDRTIGAVPWREIVTERLKPLGIPMVIDFPFGHAANMLSLPFGIHAELDADAGTLTYTESPCQESLCV